MVSMLMKSCLLKYESLRLNLDFFHFFQQLKRELFYLPCYFDFGRSLSCQERSCGVHWLLAFQILNSLV